MPARATRRAGAGRVAGARRSGKRTVKNVWPFGPGQLLGSRETVRHMRSGKKLTSSGGRYKGYAIYKRPDGEFEVPSIDKESRFDTRRDAQRFIDDEVKARRNPISGASLQEFASLFPGGNITPAILKRVAREYARVTNPGRGAFKRCVEAVAASGTAASPSGVCAAAARRKYGAKKFAKMAAAGKRRAKKNPGRKNPIGAAAETYEKFHGRPADDVFEVTETIHEHSVLSGVGKLVSITIDAIDGETEVTLHKFKGALLAQDEGAKQLYVVGGDQGVNLADFGIVAPVHETEVLGAAIKIAYETRKDHLGESGGAGERAIHVHPFGSLKSIEGRDLRRRYGSRLPMVVYDTRNKKLSFAGGGYDLPEVGIRG